MTLQVNVAPGDLPHATLTLPHQLRCWEAQVDAVSYTLDLRPSMGPRGARFAEYRPGIVKLLADLVSGEPTRRMTEVDFQDATMKAVASTLFGGVAVPAKDCFGAPFFPYFFGLSDVSTHYVLHMDCDVMFGGGAPRWLADAIALMESRPNVLFVSPLAGPPTSTGAIPQSARLAQIATQAFGSAPVLEDLETRTYRLRHMSSRIFLTDLRRLRSAGPIPILDAPPWTFGSAIAVSPYLPAETSLSGLMQRGNWHRLDRLGDGPGMWFLHPTQRGPAFVTNLPNLISAIEANEIPEVQMGHYELLDSWLNAVGPAHYKRSRPSPYRRARSAALTITGARALRKLVWRARWSRRRP